MAKTNVDCVVSETDDGIWYRHPGNDPSSSRVLVVLVHGVVGTPRGTWWDLPTLLHQALRRVPFDVLSFGYPAGVWTKASIELGAEHLTEALKNGCRDYSHLLFVTHSTGGLVVKRALTDDMHKALAQLRTPGKAYRVRELDGFALRTGQVLNFAVPHAGGNRLSYLFIVATGLVMPLALVAGFCVLCIGFVLRKPWLYPRKRGFEFGWNRIPFQLWPGNSQLAKLERSFQRVVREFDQARLPRPSSCEVQARSDDVVGHTIEDSTDARAGDHRMEESERRTTRVFRGSHPSVKEAKSPDDSVVQYIAGFLSRYADALGAAVARETIDQSLMADGATRLIGASSVGLPDFGEPHNRPAGGQL